MTASNEHGIAVYNSEINVEPSEDFADNVFQASYYKRGSGGGSVVVGRGEREFVPVKEADGGQVVAKLKCSVKRDDVEVNWLRDESVISTNSAGGRYRSVENGKERMLIVNDVQDLDDGNLKKEGGLVLGF